MSYGQEVNATFLYDIMNDLLTNIDGWFTFLSHMSTDTIITKPKSKPHDEDPVAAIRGYQEAIAKQLDALKIKLARQLDAACDTFKLLTELNVKDVLKDPQYAEFCDVLGITTNDKPAVKTSGKGKKGEIKETILSLLKKTPMNHGALKTKVQEIIGREIANQYQQLDKMVEKKLLKKDKEGLYSVA